MTSCNVAPSAPVTLQVRAPTLSPKTPGKGVPTASLPPEANSTRPADPGIRNLLDRVQSDRLMFTVGSLVDLYSRHVLSRPSDNVGGIGRARDWLVSQFNALRTENPDRPISVWTQPAPFTWNGLNVNTDNVIAVFEGMDVGAGVIVLGAHYDSISSNVYSGQSYAPGANDNASGVAAMLEVARIMAPLSHRTTILFVAFTAEETGRQGSLAFVHDYLQAQKPPIDLRAMINLDMLGSDRGPNGATDSRSIRIFSADPNDSVSRQLARQITLIVRTYIDDVDPVLQSAEERVGRWGDHQSFSAAGYAAVRLIEGLEDPSRQHNAHDTFDNVQPAYLLRTTRATLAVMSILADGPPPPKDLALHIPGGGNNSPETLLWAPVPNAERYLVTLRQSTSLYYDQVFTVEATANPALAWSGLESFSAVAVATIDKSGQMGPLSPEFPLLALPRK